MTDSFPFVVEAEASASIKLLIYAETFAEATRISEERTSELVDALQVGASLPREDDPNAERVTYLVDVRAAMGYEVAGTKSLIPGNITFDECDHEDHPLGDYDEDAA